MSAADQRGASGTRARVAARARTSSPASRSTPDARPVRPVDPDELAALEEDRTFLLASLRDLESEFEAGDIDRSDYEALKDDYTARAAVVIRTLEGHQRQTASSRRRPSWGRRLAVGATVLLVAIGAGVFVARSSGQRPAGDTITGSSRQGVRDLNLQARQQSGSGDLLGAVKTYDAVLKQDPANVEALTWRGWMLRLVSTKADGANKQLLQGQALSSLQQALAAKPDDGTALVFHAVVLADVGRPAEALAELDRVPAGSIPDFMAGTIDDFRKQIQAAAASTPAVTTPAAPTPAASTSAGTTPTTAATATP